MFKKGKVEFDDTIFLCDEVDFISTKFDESELYFRDVYISGKIIFVLCQFNHYFAFRAKKCKYLDLRGSLFRDIIDLKSSKFTKVNIGIINIIKVINLGRINIDWKENNVKKLINNQKDTNHREKAEQFRTLKENFHKIGQYDDEDKAYVEFKKHEIRANKEEVVKKHSFNKIWAYPLYWFKWLVFEQMGSFGTNPVRVFLSTLAVYLFFTFLYIILPIFLNTGIKPSITNPESLSTISKAFYHSAITFLTIGYGDFYPSGIIRWLSGIEGFIGLFLMAYFVVAFSRKVLR
ncbi:potassium channel protein [bacterium]|nr:MAG: potassium channel protein [bacterium]